MSMIPAVFELDPETQESTGIVHPFCSQGCLEGGFDELRGEVHSRGFLVVVSECDTRNHCDGTVCEECRRLLEV